MFLCQRLCDTNSFSDSVLRLQACACVRWCTSSCGCHLEHGEQQSLRDAVKRDRASGKCHMCAHVDQTLLEVHAISLDTVQRDRRLVRSHAQRHTVPIFLAVRQIQIPLDESTATFRGNTKPSNLHGKSHGYREFQNIANAVCSAMTHHQRCTPSMCRESPFAQCR